MRLQEDLCAVILHACIYAHVCACMCVSSSFRSSLLWLPPNGDLKIAGIHLLCFIMHRDPNIAEDCSINREFFISFFIS